MKQHTKLMLGFIFGVTFGLIGYYYLPVKDFAFMQKVSEVLTFLGATFLRMIFMVVVPLILSALMLGTMELGKGAGLGKVGGMSLMYTLLLSGCAVLVAVFSVNIFKPGVGLNFDAAALAGTARAPQAGPRGRQARARGGAEPQRAVPPLPARRIRPAR